MAPLKFTSLSPRQQRSIKHFMDKGFTLQLSRLPNIEFVNKDTREIEVRTLGDLLAEYDRDRREDARARASERRLQKGARA